MEEKNEEDIQTKRIVNLAGMVCSPKTIGKSF